MIRTIRQTSSRRAPAFLADLLGMLALSVIMFGCLHLPTLI